MSWIPTEVRVEDVAALAGLSPLLEDAWIEAGHETARPSLWRPFRAVGGAAVLVHDGDVPLGVAIVRAAPGMDSIDFLYARPGAHRADVQNALVAWACAHLDRIGVAPVVYTAYAFWRSEVFPEELAQPFRAAGFRAFRGVYLKHDLGAPPPLPPLPQGYALVPFDDARSLEAAHMMHACPEPDASHWDLELCVRSIAAAGAATPPYFPDGLGCMVLATDAPGAPIVAFSLSTTSGYVNHVYTLPGHRGRGLATVLLGHVLAAVKRRGLERATILTHETNPAAIRLYRTLGFEVAFTYPQFTRRR